GRGRAWGRGGRGGGGGRGIGRGHDRPGLSGAEAAVVVRGVGALRPPIGFVDDAVLRDRHAGGVDAARGPCRWAARRWSGGRWRGGRRGGGGRGPRPPPPPGRAPPQRRPRRSFCARFWGRRPARPPLLGRV